MAGKNIGAVLFIVVSVIAGSGFASTLELCTIDDAMKSSFCGLLMRNRGRLPTNISDAALKHYNLSQELTEILVSVANKTVLERASWLNHMKQNVCSDWFPKEHFIWGQNPLFLNSPNRKVGKVQFKPVTVANNKINSSSCFAGMNHTQVMVTTTRYQFIFEFLISLILVILGFIGNGICLIVLPFQSSQQAVVTLLIGIAIADTLVLLLALPLQVIPSYCLYYQRFECVKTIQDSFVYVYPIGRICHTFSVWMMVAIALDRYIAITRPFTASKFCSRKNAVRACGTIAAVSILFHIPHFFYVSSLQDTNKNKGDDLFEHNTTSEIKDMLDTDCRKSSNRVLQDVYHIGLNWLLVYLVPIVLLLYLNVRLWMAVRKAKKIHAILTKKNENTKDNMAVTLNVIIIIGIFLTCQTPSFIGTVLVSCTFKIHMDSVGAFVSIADTLMVLNSAINFAVYFLFFKRFRKQVHCLFTGQLRKKRVSFSSSSGGTQGTVMSRTSIPRPSLSSAGRPSLPRSSFSSATRPSLGPISQTTNWTPTNK